MSLLIKNAQIQSSCPKTKKNYHLVLRVISSGRKKRFPLAAYNRFTKERTQALVQTEAKISELRSQLDEKGTELEDLKTKLHKTEERIRRRKRKVCIN